MHMYFFAALACLVAYCDYRPISPEPLPSRLHHLALNFILPGGDLPGSAPTSAASFCTPCILLIEAGVLIWPTRCAPSASAEAGPEAQAEADSSPAHAPRPTAHRAPIERHRTAMRIGVMPRRKSSRSVAEICSGLVADRPARLPSMSGRDAPPRTRPRPTRRRSVRRGVGTEEAVSHRIAAGDATPPSRRKGGRRAAHHVGEGLLPGHPKIGECRDPDPEHRQPDQSAGAERHDRSGPRRRTWPGICGGGERSQGAGQSDRESDGRNLGADPGIQTPPARPSMRSRRSAAPSPRSTKSPARSPPPSISRAPRRGRSPVTCSRPRMAQASQRQHRQRQPSFQ